MASLPPSPFISSESFSLRPNFFTKPPPLLSTRTHQSKVSCNAKNGGNDQKETPGNEETFQGKLDRRNLLVGMGGLYGAAANLVSADHSPAFAGIGGPIEAPDLSKCTRGTNLNTGEPLEANCCLRCRRKSLITSYHGRASRSASVPPPTWPAKNTKLNSRRPLS
ncbi:Polyphenol oxidase, chloroplastic [Sesamum alatum]|uniref:Polyphenol oxidase, chloroplastic n=1 Tax=Sesamum alatum TaxID=300844 RepID=A0AAE2CYF7_9LAMI|nr:Polyphenol oxidase, chloroplastic [Sesamum alatum]